MLILIPIAIILLLWLRPLGLRRLRSRPQPVRSFEQAIAQIRATQQAEQSNPAINSYGYTRLHSHGQPTATAIVFFHGLTNCPEQFERLASILHSEGHNVFIPRMPHHGLKDRMTSDLARLTAEALVAYADQAVDLAQGLGEKVVVVGISAGASIAGWLAQERADLAQVVIIAPMFSVLDVPAFAVRPLASLLTLLPNRFIWWDSKRKDAPGRGPNYAYPRFSTRAMGEVLRLGYRVRFAARRNAPAAGRIVAVVNAADPAVNNLGMARIVQLWRRTRPAAISEYSFPKELGLIHDIIDPNQPLGRIDQVYPVVLELIENKKRPSQLRKP
jgi:pimeloyl-ACP methyl ester carboxylesterase